MLARPRGRRCARHDIGVPISRQLSASDRHDRRRAIRPRTGEWTDDTSMAPCLADSLIENGDLDETDLMRRFVRWWRYGENSATGWFFDIGFTTRTALSEFERSGNPRAGSENPKNRRQWLSHAPRAGCHPPPQRPHARGRICPAAERHHARRSGSGGCLHILRRPSC